jgi:anti-anti-sigma regulatory factor
MSLINEPSSLEVTTSFDGPNTVLSLRGRVESLAAFDLWAALEGAINLHCQSVVLDLSELDFVGAAGLLVALANAEMLFAEAGIELTVRTPSRFVQRLLGVMELTEVAQADEALSGLRDLGRQQVGESNHLSIPSISKFSTEALRRMSAIEANPDVVDRALRLVVELVQTFVSGADAVSVSLLRHGELLTVAATDEAVMKMDGDQFATREGPCFEASLRGRWFHAESLETETRWPSFTPQARALGIMAILSLPLSISEEPVGALNIYSRTGLKFDVNAQRVAALCARNTSVFLSDAHVGVTDVQVAVQFQEALRSREIIATAKGIVMERESMNEDEAFTNLLRQSVRSGVSLLSQAEAFGLSTEQPEPPV